MKRLVLVASVGAVVLLAAACGGSQSRGSEGAGHSADNRASPSVAEPSRGERTSANPSGEVVAPKIEPEALPGEARVVEGEPLRRERIDGTALPRNYPRKVHVTGDGSSLAIVVKEGGCVQVVPEVVEQTTREVTVVLVETTPDEQVACTMDMRFPTVTVQLAEPLGQRDVVLRVRQE